MYIFRTVTTMRARSSVDARGLKTKRKVRDTDTLAQVTLPLSSRDKNRTKRERTLRTGASLHVRSMYTYI